MRLETKLIEKALLVSHNKSLEWMEFKAHSSVYIALSVKEIKPRQDSM